MEHSFNVEIATKYGMLEAVLLNHIYFWVKKNESNDKHFHEGKYWTYNSIKAFNELFPYATERKISNALKHLEEEGLISTGNFNEKPFDKTKWYALNKSAYSILQNRQIDTAKMSNGSCKNVEPIPDNKPDINTDIKRNSNSINTITIKKSHFQPPTLEEINEYIKEKKLIVDGKQFFEYFDVGNWIDSKGNKVKNWKQKLLTWNKFKQPVNRPKSIGEMTDEEWEAHTAERDRLFLEMTGGVPDD